MKGGIYCVRNLRELNRDEREVELVDAADRYGFVDQDFIGLVPVLIGPNQNEQLVRDACSDVSELFVWEFRCPADVEVVVGGLRLMFEIEEGFRSCFDHRVGDDGVAACREGRGKIGGEGEGGLLT